MSSPLKTTQNVSAPREFFVAERTRFYSEWMLSFWRELFQNSLDAGAKSLKIDINTHVEPSKPGTSVAKPVTRVSFVDDGVGMTAKILDDVYFSLGKTTKTDETTVGGFGRARLMTCFSHLRYGLRTQDRVIEGSGGSYGHFSVAEAIGIYEGAAAEALADADTAKAAGDDELFRYHFDLSERMNAKAASLREQGEFFKGCAIEVDMDPNETTSTWRRPSAENVKTYLERYLSESDIKAEIVINGVTHQPVATKLKGRRDIFAKFKKDDVPESWRKNTKIKICDRPDGYQDVAFGRIAMSSDKEPNSSGIINGGRLITRVGGASMFSRDTNVTGACVYVELNPAIARDVLTSNRDGFKAGFVDAVDDLIRQLATDSKAALAKSDEDEFRIFSGGLGRKTSKIDISKYEESPDYSKLSPKEANTLSRLSEVAEDRYACVYYQDYSSSWDELIAGRIDGIKPKLILEFLDKIIKHDNIDESFLGRYKDKEDAESFLVTLKRQGGHRALVEASGTLLGFIVNQLEKRAYLAELKERAKNRDRIARTGVENLYDIPIARGSSEISDHLASEQVAARRAQMNTQMRRHDPMNWNLGTGAGMRPRKVLAAWQVAVDNVVTISQKLRPGIKKFEYSSGWVFAQPEWKYDASTDGYSWSVVGAQMNEEKIAGMDVKYFLLNPLDSDLKPKFNPMDADDRDTIITLAIHEVAHIRGTRHNDEFAYFMTDLVKAIPMRERRRIHAEMVEAVKAVDRVYAAGKTRVAPMDDEPGPRPSERLISGLGAGHVMKKRPDGGFEVDTGDLDDFENEASGMEPEQEHEDDRHYAPSM